MKDRACLHAVGAPVRLTQIASNNGVPRPEGVTQKLVPLIKKHGRALGLQLTGQGSEMAVTYTSCQEAEEGGESQRGGRHEEGEGLYVLDDEHPRSSRAAPGKEEEESATARKEVLGEVAVSVAYLGASTSTLDGDPQHD